MKKMNAPTVTTLEYEVAWFSEIVDHQFNTYFNPQHGDGAISSIVPPDLSGDTSYYANIVNEYNLNYKERLGIMLALMPHIKPNLLDIFFTKNSHFDRNFTEFGGTAGKRFAGFLPTGETLHFILNKGSVSARFEVEAMLGAGHLLVARDIIRLERAELYEPVLSGMLTVTEEFLNYLVSGELQLPAASNVFPAKRVSTALNWNDLVVNKDVLEEVELIKQWIDSGEELMVHDTFRKHVKPGFRALFYGPPGTGKTLTACLLGKTTGLDVYRIDLSMIVSKYIGETEKNLSRIFDYAEKYNWILFFDEADALFGKRTQTSSSNDRYANQEVSYLLQRIEDFSGVIILASNLKANIDEAFSRRFQSMVYFSMPTKEQRLALWRQFFSGSIRTVEDFDLSSIADDYELSGGSAINVFRYSVLRAAARKSTQVHPDDILQGIKREYQKIGKTLKI